ncbi:unnamed protein product [Arctogadus glacialis]
MHSQRFSFQLPFAASFTLNTEMEDLVLQMPSASPLPKRTSRRVLLPELASSLPSSSSLMCCSPEKGRRRRL